VRPHPLVFCLPFDATPIPCRYLIHPFRKSSCLCSFVPLRDIEIGSSELAFPLLPFFTFVLFFFFFPSLSLWVTQPRIRVLPLVQALCTGLTRFPSFFRPLPPPFFLFNSPSFALHDALLPPSPFFTHAKDT